LLGRCSYCLSLSHSSSPRKDVLTHDTRVNSVSLDIIMVCEINQLQKDKYCLLPLKF
jgi:hypothetical protein